MKKILLLLTLLTLSMGKAKADEGGFTLKFCGDLYSWYYLANQNKLDYKCFIYVPAEMATMIAGNQITDITFSCTSDFSTTREGEVFVAEEYDEDPITSTACTVQNCYQQYVDGGDPFQTVVLDEPYTIKEGTGFYFGYVVKNCRYSQSKGADYPVSVDGKSSNGFSGYVQLLKDGEEQYFCDLGKEVGTNLFLAATTVGESTGFKNVFTLGNMSFGNFTLPVFDATASEPIIVPIHNIGDNALTSIEYSIDINGVTGESKSMEINVAPYANTYIEIPAPKYSNGRNDVTLKITKANDADQMVQSSASCIALDGNGFDRKFVVEEGTGAWCGNCPRGIVGLDKMAEKYPDTFIGIAVHSGDNLAAASYASLLNLYFDGYPSCIINRDSKYVLDPNFDDLEDAYETWQSQRAAAKVEMNVENGDNGLNVSTATTFAFNEDGANYRLAFVLLEDGLVDNQSNYFSGQSGSLEWWDEQGSTVTWTYEHTARDIFDCFGLEGSIPTTIVADEPMAYETTLSTKHITDLDKTTVVALVIDCRTNTILNAESVAVNPATQGISEITSNEHSRIYNLQGIELQQPSRPGLYIINGKKFLRK